MADPYTPPGTQFFRNPPRPDVLGTPAGLEALEAERSGLASFLGKTDYSAQNQEANDFAKLQFALSLMGRGFASMGAAPQPGENALGAVGRTLVAPLAGDISTISGPLMQQRAATRLAEQQEDRQLKLSALDRVQSRQDKARADDVDAANSARQVLLAERNGTSTVSNDFSVDGKNIPVVQKFNSYGNFLGFFHIDGTRIDAALVQPKPDPAANSGPKISDTGVFRQIIGFSPDGMPGYGPQVETKAMYFPGTGMVQVRDDTGTGIRVGDAIGDYRRYEKPSDSAGGAAKGVESPDFKATLMGYLSNLGGQQDSLGLGKVGIKFVPGNYDPAKGLDPSQDNYPFARVDGQALTLAEKTKFTSQITNGYFNAFEAIRGGANLVDINKAFSECFFRQNVEQLGLRPAPSGGPPNPYAARTEAAVAAFYARAPRLFEQQGDVGGVLEGMPVPATGQNFTSGIGKLKLFSLAGVPFGPGTNSPPPTLPGQDVTIRARDVMRMDRGSIQQRVTAERIAKGVSLAGRLSQSASPRLDDQVQVVSDAITGATAGLKTRQNDPASIQTAQMFTAAVDALDNLDRMSVAAELSNVQGITGPMIGAGIRFTGTDFSAWFKDNQELEATRVFVAGLPVLRELFGRTLVKSAEGDSARVSNRDLQGVQETLPKLGENQGYSREKLAELRRHLVSIMKNTASQLGNFVVPDSVLEKAALLGLDLKEIQGQGGYYNPFLKNGEYSVTKGQIPELSKDYLASLRAQGLFARLSDGESNPRFKMIKVSPDKNKTYQPVYDGKNVSYVILSRADLTNPAFKEIVDFNLNWIRNTYRVGK